MAHASKKVSRSATGKASKMAVKGPVKAPSKIAPATASKSISTGALNPARKAVAIKPAAKTEQRATAEKPASPAVKSTVAHAPSASAKTPGNPKSSAGQVARPAASAIPLATKSPAISATPPTTKSPAQALIVSDETYLDLAFTSPQDAAEVINEQIATAHEMIRRLTQTFLEQGRSGYGQYKGSLEEANQSLQQSLEAVAEDVQALRLKQLELMQAQCQAGFDLAKSLITADSFANALQIAFGFAQKQGDALAQGQKELAGLTRHMTENSLAPIYASMKYDPFGIAAARAA